MRLVVVLMFVLAGTGHAQTRAIHIDSTDDQPAAGLVVTSGPAGQVNGASGWSTRIDSEVVRVLAGGELGAVMTMQSGFEFWGSGADNWGFSWPLAIAVGARTTRFRAMIGGGFDVLLVDQVDDDTGVGLYAPFALAKAGADVAGFHVGVESRLGYRWQFDADDHARWQVGVFVAKLLSPSARTRRSRVARQ